MATGASSISRAPRPSSLADVLDLILDKGLVIDAYVRVSLAGIELLTVDARVVVASVDTYLRFAEAVNRLDLSQTEEQGLPALFGNRRNGDGNGNGDGNEDGRGRREVGRGSQAQDHHRDGDGGNQRSRVEAGGRRRGGEEERDADDGGGVLGRIAERARR